MKNYFVSYYVVVRLRLVTNSASENILSNAFLRVKCAHPKSGCAEWPAVIERTPTSCCLIYIIPSLSEGFITETFSLSSGSAVKNTLWFRCFLLMVHTYMCNECLLRCKF